MAKKKSGNKTGPAVRKFKNRIVGHGEVDPRSLRANAKNWRRHPEAQRAALSGALSEVGWVGSVIVNNLSGNIVDGHARVELAIANNETKVPVVYVELTEDEESLVLATFDPISAMASTDQDALTRLIGTIKTEDDGIRDLIQQLTEAGARQVTFIAGNRQVIRSEDRQLLLIECKTERDLNKLFDEMKARGFECKIMN